MRVLIVDDEPGVREFCGRALRGGDGGKGGAHIGALLPRPAQGLARFRDQRRRGLDPAGDARCIGKVVEVQGAVHAAPPVRACSNSYSRAPRLQATKSSSARRRSGFSYQCGVGACGESGAGGGGHSRVLNAAPLLRPRGLWPSPEHGKSLAKTTKA